MNKKNSFLMIIAVIAISTFSTSAQTTVPHNGKTKFSIEVDPTTFAFNGYSAHLRVQPKSSQHVLYGIGIYAMDMPSFFVDMNANNADMGWQVRINSAVGLFGEYHFTEVNRKFFVGSQISSQQFLIKNENYAGQEEKFNNALLMGYAGYTLQPFKFNLYFKFWGGIGYTTKTSGVNQIEGQEYDISPISVFATLHIGYTF
jgi:hypothetical protein